MNSDLAHAAEISPTAPAAPLAVEGAAAALEHVTGWHALVGLPIGVLRGMSPGTDLEVIVEGVHEQTPDLAVADRVAWILSGRTGRQHVVLATATGYLVATVSPMLDWAAAMRLEPNVYSPRVVSVAAPDGVLPVLLPIAG